MDEKQKLKSKAKAIYIISSVLFVITTRLMDLVILHENNFNKDTEIKIIFVLVFVLLIFLIKQSYSIYKKF